MIEHTVLNYLKENIGVPVLMELPEVPSEDFPEWPEQFVVIEKIAGTRRNFVNNTSMAFQSYSTERLEDAALLDEQVRAAMDNIIELDTIGGVRLASNYNFTDSRTKRYRYQCVYEIYYIGG